jgi:ribosome recycling factor
MTTIPELTKHARDLMHKAVESTKREFSGIRSNKATPSLLDTVRVEAYGSLIRVPLPALSEERRKELVKVVHKLAEEGRIAVRHARTDAISRIKKLEHVSSDDKTRAEKDVQKLTDDHIKQIDGLIHAKEAEIMEV